MSLPEPVSQRLPPALGIFGGTFDPVHLGHLRLAEEAREQLALARVLWLPAGAPPLRDAPRSSAAHRLAMVAAAIADNPAFVLDAGEAQCSAPSYTIDTLERLRAQYGQAQPLVLLLGADAFLRLEQWHRWQELFDFAHIAVATRPGHALEKVIFGGTAAGTGSALARAVAARQGDAGALTGKPAGAVVSFSISALDISATALRATLAASRSGRYLISAPVLHYIDQHHLYA